MTQIFMVARCPEHGLHGLRSDCFVCGGPVERVPMVPSPAVVVEQRDRWIRAFNRLDAAVSHHKRDCQFADAEDEALWATRDRILRDLGGGSP